MFVCCECCVLSGRSLCNELITHPEEFCQMWCVIVCDLETSGMRRPWPALGRSTTGKKNFIYLVLVFHKFLERNRHCTVIMIRMFMIISYLLTYLLHGAESFLRS